MTDLPEFRLYGESDPSVAQAIQPTIPFRRWNGLSDTDKSIALQQLINKGWVDKHSDQILWTIEHLNQTFLRQCPGKRLHAIKPEFNHRGHGSGNEYERKEAALEDFKRIFAYEKSDDLVLHMLSKFAQCQIDGPYYRMAREAKSEESRRVHIDDAFKKFDRLASCLNHIFEQFSVDQWVTRNGFVPRQDNKIIEQIYLPTLKVLAHPKWATVSADLAAMFEDYRKQNYAEAITKAHRSVQRFLQVSVGEEGKSGKGELGKLFQEARKQGVISVNRFTEPVMTALLGFVPAERATNSTAKPAVREATSSDALLMMNVVMILLQHCLQNVK